MELWYHKPAHAWVEALPLGNGRIGAMVYGGIKNEKLSLNEDTLWSGYPRDLHRQDVYPAYVEARDCALRGDVLHAQEVLETRMLGPYGQAYMPLGDLLLTMDHEEEAEDYRRTLDLGKAVSTVDYTIQDVCYHRQCFISAPAQTLVLQLTADQDASISCHITLQCALKSQITAQGTSIILEGICPSHAQPNYLQDPHPLCYDETPEKRGIRFYAQAEVLHTGGTLHVEDGVLTIQHADAVTLLFCVRSNFAGYDKAPEMAGKAYIAPCIADIAHAKEALDTLLSSHISDYQQYFSRVSLHLDGNRNPNLPTDERLLANAQSHDDVGLIEQLFQYGRYLMISASRPGTQPMNLQGIWNDSVIPPWSSNYTVNINTEMNYWPAFLCNLGEMNEPLVSLIRDISVAGRKTAQTYYHARGFVSHHNIDLWRMTTPVGDGRKGAAVYGFWPMSSGWLCEHLFAQYAFTGDEAFLRDTAYPLMKEAALFYLDVLVEDDAGHLIFAPSTSPENCYLLDGIPCAISRTTTMTTAILRELFTNCISACNV
ncbi:MAG: glycoside hydrolase family 95 protein, partial [Clostridia bacterium]